MTRPEYHSKEQRERLFKNTRKDLGNNGIRDFSILKHLYSLPVRPIEMCRFSTRDFVDSRGNVLLNEDAVIRAEISFNGRERQMPINNPDLITALQDWINWRIANSWGITSTGFINLDTPLYQSKKNHRFSIITSYKNGVPKHNTDSICRVIRRRLKDNALTGSVDSAIRTWTIENHRAGRSHIAMQALRGDDTIRTVRTIAAKDPVRLGALVEYAY